MDAPQWPPAWAACLQLGDRRKALGLAFIVAVAVIWVGASFVVQGIEEQGAHPAVLTLVANSLFAIYVPIYFGNLRWRRRRAEQAAAQQQQHAAEAAALVPAGAPQSDEEGDTLAPPPGLQAAAAGGAGGAPPMPLRQLFRAALVVAPLWYAAQLTFNLSLSKTSVTSNTILSSTSALFTFLFAVALLAEAFTLPKLGFILLLIAGTAMVTLADGEYGGGGQQAAQSVAGDLLCLVSAVIYGAYTVAIRKLLREDDDTPMTMFFGFMGLLILLAVGPLLLALWLLGVPLGTLSWRVFGLMVAKGLADNVLSDYLWARAILLVGPTVATSGLALQVPLAVALDAALRSPAWLSRAGSTVLTLVGGAAVLGGFFGINAAGEDDEKTRHALWEAQQEALQRELGFDLEDPEEEEHSRAQEGQARSPSDRGAPAVPAQHRPPHALATEQQPPQRDLRVESPPKARGGAGGAAAAANGSARTPAAVGEAAAPNGSVAAAGQEERLDPKAALAAQRVAMGKKD